jgi:Leucine-rich repeat (LRR) protein
VKKITTIILTILLSTIIHQNTYAQEYGRELDSLALVALYDSTNGEGWSNNENWISAQKIDDWYGVTVEGDRVTQIRLKSNNLSGPIPDEICNLTELLVLDFYVNSLSGTIPANIGNLSNLLQLSLNHNQLEGSIPESLWQLTNLQLLFLNSNDLSGSIPGALGDLIHLERLILFENSFSDSLPSSIGNLKRLRELNLYRNSFSGSLPSNITQLDSLRELTIWNNMFEGPIPKDIDKLTRLERLSIASNRFSGHIPASIGNLTNLKFLSLNANSLDGPIPESIGNLTELTVIQINSNNFTGIIPDTLRNLKKVTSLYLNYNQLTGPSPAALGQMTGLTALIINGNMLSGAVPAEITKLTEMNTLLLRDNQLDDLPDLSSLTKLTHLSLENNRFTFEDIVPNMVFASHTFVYAPQAKVGIEVDTVLNIGESILMSVTVGGENNSYQWYHNNLEIPAAQSDSFDILAVTLADTGVYECHVTNEMVPDLTIKSYPIKIKVVNPTGVKTEFLSIPNKFALSQNYPNPFNPKTVIGYQLPNHTMVKLSIYNLLGQLVTTLVSEKQQPGKHEVIWDASGFPSGIYIYRIQADGHTEVKKMLLIQ